MVLTLEQVTRLAESLHNLRTEREDLEGAVPLEIWQQLVCTLHGYGLNNSRSCDWAMRVFALGSQDALLLLRTAWLLCSDTDKDDDMRFATVTPVLLAILAKGLGHVSVSKSHFLDGIIDGIFDPDLLNDCSLSDKELAVLDALSDCAWSNSAKHSAKDNYVAWLRSHGHAQLMTADARLCLRSSPSADWQTTSFSPMFAFFNDGLEGFSKAHDCSHWTTTLNLCSQFLEFIHYSLSDALEPIADKNQTITFQSPFAFANYLESQAVLDKFSHTSLHVYPASPSPNNPLPRTLVLDDCNHCTLYVHPCRRSISEKAQLQNICVQNCTDVRIICAPIPGSLNITGDSHRIHISAVAVRDVFISLSVGKDDGRDRGDGQSVRDVNMFVNSALPAIVDSGDERVSFGPADVWYKGMEQDVRGCFDGEDVFDERVDWVAEGDIASKGTVGGVPGILSLRKNEGTPDDGLYAEEAFANACWRLVDPRNFTLLHVPLFQRVPDHEPLTNAYLGTVQKELHPPLPSLYFRWVHEYVKFIFDFKESVHIEGDSEEGYADDSKTENGDGPKLDIDAIRINIEAKFKEWMEENGKYKELARLLPPACE
ncbi:hypothetical protein HDU81_001237 [Chytriomyces hyalinus]|nr:hypothetical protein HDU81_001237 [Chytriomyces hyalinus]